jgi:hypothetical protein
VRVSLIVTRLIARNSGSFWIAAQIGTVEIRNEMFLEVVPVRPSPALLFLQQPV